MFSEQDLRKTDNCQHFMKRSRKCVLAHSQDFPHEVPEDAERVGSTTCIQFSLSLGAAQRAHPVCHSGSGGKGWNVLHFGCHHTAKLRAEWLRFGPRSGAAKACGSPGVC